MNDSVIEPDVEAALTVIEPVAEAALGTLILFCFLVGVPGNLLATIYFVQEHLNNARNTKKLFFTEIYISMTTVDLILTITLFPVFENYFSGHRDGYLFRDRHFCLLWGFLWEIVPCISVFLVGLLSFSRMLILVRPMQSLNLNVLRAILFAYFLYHFILRVTLIMADDDPSDIYNIISYTDTAGYCYFTPNNTQLWYFNAYHAGVVLGLPILPISLSFILSIFKLRESASSPSTQNFSRVAQTQATITIIIVTSVYLICNLPLFINYCFYSHVIITDNAAWEKYFYYYDKNKVFMGWYIWNVTFIDLVSLNSAINPIVFFLRMKPFREFVKALLPVGKTTMTKTKAIHMPGKSIREITSSSF